MAHMIVNGKRMGETEWVAYLAAGLRSRTFDEVAAFKPEYDRWRHGGWYVTNIHYPSGAVGCVSNNYADKKWRIACIDQNLAFAFSTRDDAAKAEALYVAMLIQAAKSAPPAEQQRQN